MKDFIIAFRQTSDFSKFPKRYIFLNLNNVLVMPDRSILVSETMQGQYYQTYYEK